MAAHDLATVTNPSAALTDFTLIVDLSNMSASWWSTNDTADGTKGRVFKGDGTTELASDWIDFDNGAETGLLRVKWSGTLASSGTQQLWVEPPLAANASYAANDTYGSDNAYDANWGGYWPDMETDRTSNGNDGTGVGGITLAGGTGPIGKATNYEGTDDGVDYGTGPSISGAGDFMVSVAMKSTMTAQATLVGQRNGGYNGAWKIIIDATDSHPQYSAYLSSYEPFEAELWGANDVTDDTWQYLTMNKVTDTAYGYLAGSAQTSAANDRDAVATLSIQTGYNKRDSSEYFVGLLAEFQIHTTSRSAAWIASEHSQVSDNSTFWGSWTWVAATYTVDTDGVSGDYATLEAAMNGIGTLTENTIVNIDSDAGADTTACTVDITLDGYTLDIVNVGSDLYRLHVSAQWGTVLTIASKCTITGIEVYNSDQQATGQQRGIQNNATDVVIKDSVVRECIFEGIRDNGTTNKYVNLFIYDLGNARGEGFRKHGNGGDAYLYNCTIVGAGTYGVFGGDFRTLYTKNCYVADSGTADLYEDTNGDINLTTTYTEDGSLSTTTAAYSTSAGSYMLDITPDETDDMKVGGSSSLIGNGTDLSADATYPFSTDFYGTTRSSWDIGSYEYVASGADYNLTFNPVVTAAPDIDDLVMTQDHQLGFTSVATQAPVVADLVLDQDHLLVFADVITGAPVNGNLVITQEHVMVFTEVVTGAVNIGLMRLLGYDDSYNPRDPYFKQRNIISMMMGGE